MAVRCALVLATALVVLTAGTAGAQTRNPCSSAAAREDGFALLAESGKLRVVEPAGSFDSYACTPRHPRGLRLSRGDFSEPCGSNSSRTVGVPDTGGAAITPRYAVVAVNVVNDNCEDDDAFTVLRVDLSSGRRTVVAAGKGSYAAGVALNADGTAAWTVDDRELRLAAIGERARLLLVGGAGSGAPPTALRMGPGRRPALRVEQGVETFLLDTAAHLRARARCGDATRLVTPLLAVAPRRVCRLRTGTSFTRAGCTAARGTELLCGTRLVDATANRVRLTHPALAGRRERVGLVRYDMTVLDAVAVPGGRAVVIREGVEEVFTNAKLESSTTTGVSEVVLLLPGGAERVLRRTSTYDLRRLRLDGRTVRWRESGNDGGGPRSAALPAAP